MKSIILDSEEQNLSEAFEASVFQLMMTPERKQFIGIRGQTPFFRLGVYRPNGRAVSSIFIVDIFHQAANMFINVHIKIFYGNKG